MGTINLTGNFDTGIYQQASPLSTRQAAEFSLASKAMMGILARMDTCLMSEEELAVKSFACAKAMLAEAGKYGIYP